MESSLITFIRCLLSTVSSIVLEATIVLKYWFWLALLLSKLSETNHVKIVYGQIWRELTEAATTDSLIQWHSWMNLSSETNVFFADETKDDEVFLSRCLVSNTHSANILRPKTALDFAEEKSTQKYLKIPENIRVNFWKKRWFPI